MRILDSIDKALIIERWRSKILLVPREIIADETERAVKIN